MQELEKILEELEKEAMNNPEVGRKQCEGMMRAMNIIRKHMNEKATAHDLISRQALLDDFRNTITENSDTFDWLNMIARQPAVNKGDGWIPSKKHLPKAPEMEDEYPEFNVMIEGAKTPTTLQYSHEGIWVDDYGNVYNVIAWQPLPEPYIPETQNARKNYEPEWRTKLLNKFDRRL